MPNYTVSATSNESNAWKAFDNKVDTHWTSGETSSQLVFDFGFRTDIKGVRFTPTVDNIQAFPGKIVLEGKSDEDYEPIETFTLEAPEAEVPQSFVLEEPVKYKTYRFTLSESASGNPGIAEIEFLLPKNIVVPEPILQAKTATPTMTAQTITADETYQGLSEVTVEAAPLQEKTASPSDSSQIILPDSGIYGLSKVTVEAAPLKATSVSPTANAQTIVPGEGYYGLSNVIVLGASLQEKTVSPSTTSQTITPDSGQYGLSKVTVSAATLQQKTITPSTSQQTVTPDSSYYGLSKVIVNAAPSTTPKLQTKTVTPSTSSQNVTPDSSYDGLSKVTVSRIPYEYMLANDIYLKITVESSASSNQLVVWYSGGANGILTEHSVDLNAITTSSYSNGFPVQAGMLVFANNASTSRSLTFVSSSNATLGEPIISGGYYNMTASNKVTLTGKNYTPFPLILKDGNSTGIVTITIS